MPTHLYLFMNPTAPLNLEELVRRARLGDADAWSALYRAYAGPMKGVCLRLLGPWREAADDLVHDAFLLAFSDISRLRNPERFGQWLTTIVTHLTLQYLRQQRRHPALHLSELPPDGWPATEPDADPEEGPTEQELAELIERLPEGYRQVFRLAVVEGLPHAEIARRLGIAPHSSSSQLHRAKALLRKMLAHRQAGLTLLLIALLWPWNERPPYHSGRFSRLWSLPQTQPYAGRQAVAPVRHTAGPSKPPVLPAPRHRAGSTLQPDTLPTGVQPDLSHRPATPLADLPMPDSSGIRQPDRTPIYPNLYAEARRQPSDRKKWKLLLSGAAGPALAQSLYKLIRPDHGDDIGSGLVPPAIDTWEEYYDYLLTRNPASMPADSALLLHIAQSNSGRIVEQARHSRPLTFGLSLSHKLSPRWQVETGLQYSLLKSTFSTGSGGNLIQERQRVHYLSLPLKFSYIWLSHGRWEAYTSAGAALHIPLGGRVRKMLLTDTVALDLDRYRVRPAWQGSVSAGLGVQYHFTPHLGLYLEPTVRYYLPTVTSTRTIWTEHPLTFSLPLGLRLTW